MVYVLFLATTYSILFYMFKILSIESLIKNNMVISEIKTKGERGFVITIRNDGKDRDYRMGQLSFLSEKDLILIRDSIDRILNM